MSTCSLGGAGGRKNARIGMSVRERGAKEQGECGKKGTEFAEIRRALNGRPRLGS